MERLHRAATERSPQLDFDFPNRRLRIEGESYPEDAAAFYGPVLKALETFLWSSDPLPPDSALVLDLHLSYFNSSSAKALMNIFQMLELAASRGLSTRINWHYHPDDDAMLEFGEDFREDFRFADFHLCEIEANLAG